MRELQWLPSDLPRGSERPAGRRRSRSSCSRYCSSPSPPWLVTVPPEVTVAMVLIFLVFAILAAFLLSPIWIPVLLAFVAYRVIRSRAAGAAPCRGA